MARLKCKIYFVEIDKNVVLSEDLPAIGSLEKGTYKYVRYNGTKYQDAD